MLWRAQARSKCLKWRHRLVSRRRLQIWEFSVGSVRCVAHCIVCQLIAFLKGCEGKCW